MRRTDRCGLLRGAAPIGLLATVERCASFVRLLRRWHGSPKEGLATNIQYLVRAGGLAVMA